MAGDVVMTQEDYDALRAEVHDLETRARAEIAERIRTAREWGDLKENSEYHDAKHSQALLETRILRLRDQLVRAEIVEVAPARDTVAFGNQVTLLDRGSGRELRYTLVSAVDADAAAGKLSMESPVGRTLMGSRRGDVVEIVTPKGTRTLEILTIA